jgi:preprotein translocase subunit SecG
MTTLFSAILIIAAILLILIVLVQNSKGGGLASNFSSNNQILGVRKTTDFLEKATWTLAITLLVVSLAYNVMGRGSDVDARQSATEKQLENGAPAPTTTPAPTTAPAPAPVTPPPAQ